jgi:hypothetical protein
MCRGRRKREGERESTRKEKATTTKNTKHKTNRKPNRKLTGGEKEERKGEWKEGNR